MKNVYKILQKYSKTFSFTKHLPIQDQNDIVQAAAIWYWRTSNNTDTINISMATLLLKQATIKLNNRKGRLILTDTGEEPEVLEDNNLESIVLTNTYIKNINKLRVPSEYKQALINYLKDGTFMFTTIKEFGISPSSFKYFLEKNKKNLYKDIVNGTQNFFFYPRT